MKQGRGFSLIEMAFVLVIVTLLLGGLLVPFATQVEQRRITETQKGMEEIKEALIGFAVVNGRLPCPDTTVAGAGANDGLEDPAGGPCAVPEGNLPWATLGVTNSDAWGNHFRYRVTAAFATNVGFTLGPPASAGTLEVCSSANCPAGTVIANQVPAVVISHGRNGYGAINVNRPAGDTTTNPCIGAPAACSPDETENLSNTDNEFVLRTITPAGTPATEFDDLVTWISPNILFNRMVAAGRLPN